MRKKEIVAKIIKAAQNDKRKRRDIRYINTMAFLTTKGFLKANQKFFVAANIRIPIEDAIWAGKNVEPRILEVLPAAVLRLEKHFVFIKNKNKEIRNLEETIIDLKNQRDDGQDFLDVPYRKLKVWVNFKLKDGRIKTQEEKKIAKNYRLHPEAIDALKKKARKAHLNETAFLEKLIFEG